MQLMDLRILEQGILYRDEKHPIVLKSMDFPDPVNRVLLFEPKTKADVDKMGMALAKLAEEDPTFTVQYRPGFRDKLLSLVWVNFT